MKYDAFISYRHAALDMDVAKKLHKALETYHIPKSVQKKTGKKRINRVFRDQEELPIGSDLNDNISAALREAEYLIVICSPDTPESYWVLKEIETFIEMHDREHVLAILADGEPWTSFPAPLLTDDNGNPVEPLAADIRGATPKERNQKFRSEFLRLAAPLIGCTYDDLRQRHKERIIRRNITIGGIALGVVALFGAAFGIYNAVTAAKMKKLAEEKAALAEERTRMAGEILTELRAKQENQSRFYAEESSRLLQSGKREDAILLAMAGLPGEDGDRPFVSEAEYALSNALYAYNGGSSYQFDRTLPHEYSVREFWLSDDQTRLVSVDSSRKVYVWNTEDMSLLATIAAPMSPSGMIQSVITANADADAIYVCYANEFIKWDYSGKRLKTISTDEGFFQHADIHTSVSRAALAESHHTMVVDLESFQVISTSENTQPNGFSEVIYSPESNLICASHYVVDGASQIILSVVNGETGETTDISVPGKSVFETSFTKNGNIAVLHSEGDFFNNTVNTEIISLFAPDGKKLWTKEISCKIIPSFPVYNLMDTRSFTGNEGGEVSHVVISVQFDTFTFDEMTGEVLGHFSHAHPVSGMYLYPKSNLGYFSFINGDISPIDTISGLFYSEYTIPTTLTATGMKACPVNDCFIVSENSSTTLYSLKKIPAPDKTALTEFPDGCLYETSHPEGKYFVTSSHAKDVYFFGPDGEQLYNYILEDDYIQKSCFVDDTFVIVGHENLVYINPFEKTEETVPFGSLLLGETYYSNSCFNANSSYITLFTASSAVGIADIKKKEGVAEVRVPSGIVSARVTPDGSTLYVVLQTGELKAYEVATEKEIDLSSYEIPAAGTSLNNSPIQLSPSGKYLAVYGSDNKLYVYTTGDYSRVAEFSLNCNYNFCLEFTPDEKTVIAQDDDYRVFFYDIEKKAYINTLKLDWDMKNCTFDSANNVTAITDGLDLYLVNNEDYGTLAFVPDGIVYVAGERLFITKNRNEKASIKYKNYRELIAAAKEQFPGAELSDEKKIKYNVN